MRHEELLTNGELPTSWALTAGANLRIMTSNVLASRWGEDQSPEKALIIPPYEVRSELYARVLEAYLPDLVGVQESDTKWLERFPQRLEELEKRRGVRYNWIHREVGDFFNLTTILYRADRYRLWDAGYEIAPYWRDPAERSYRCGYCIRGVFWGMLEALDDPKRRVVLVNTHWTPDVQNDTCIANRRIDAALQIEIVNRLREKYQAPVFCTGDFNTKQEDPLVRRLESGAGLRDLYTDSIRKGVLTHEPFGGLGLVGAPHNMGYNYDHLFGVGDYELLRYEILREGNLIWLSDHLPQVADVRI